MVRIAPVRLAFNPKTLWFDANELDLSVGDAVVVNTARGREFGRVSQALFDMEYEDTKKLKSPLKDVIRVATEEDVERAEEKAELSMEALPTFRRLAADYAPDMNPIAVEYLFDADKAVFYFDAEERVDFRDLVRKLAAELSIKVDMKQIGVRDGARMVGGLGHCGQELCCARLGGNFNPVSIHMAKEQDLSLNPQKISGLCGRLMCCLRYEFEAYKDFHSRAPKKNARVQTPDGEGKVVDLDVPREIVSIKVGDEKPVKVPLADMEPPEEGNRPKKVGAEAWEKAQAPISIGTIGSSSDLFTSQLSAEDKLAEPGKVSRMPGGEQKSPGGGSSSRRRRRRGGSGSKGGAQQQKQQSQQKQQQKQHGGNDAGSSAGRRKQRRRSTKVSAEGSAAEQKKNVQVGRNSSALRANRNANQAGGQAGGAAKTDSGGSAGSGRSRRRRRSHKTNSSGSQGQSE